MFLLAIVSRSPTPAKSHSYFYVFQENYYKLTSILYYHYFIII